MKFFKFNLFILSILFFLFSISITAQQQNSADKKITSLAAGSWSMQFGYNNNLGFNSFKGENISAKYHYTDNTALRFGVDINFRNKNRERSNSSQLVNNVNLSDETENSFDIRFFTDYVHYFSTKNSVNLFIAAGPFAGIGYTNTIAKNSYQDIDSLLLIRNLKINSWFIGAEFSIGVEWFVTPNFSIHGEYITKITYNYYKSVSSETNFRSSSVIYGDSKVKEFSFNPNNVLIGVSVYF